jgi:hypothetical protein
VATEISVANFKTALGECYDAIASENVADAKKWYRLAVAQRTGLLAAASGEGVSVARESNLEPLRQAIEDLARSNPDGGLYELHSRWVI